jgi:NAD(P)-dependent dehydrogenase (short-subunit alcohol dehydrogenase family)
MTRVAIITGGSRGIGAACARLAAARGFAVAVNYASNEAAASELVDTIRATGGVAEAIQADIGVPDEVERLFAETDRRLGPCVALVNNAGIIGGRMGKVESFDAAALERLFAVNVIGAILCATAAAARMRTLGGGAVVNISSVAATLGGANAWVPYGATKGAIDSLTIGLSREWAGQNIRVNAVAPGLIDTEIHAAAGARDRAEAALAQVPMRRFGTAEEVAETVVWLMADAPGYLTGAVIPIGGGR